MNEREEFGLPDELQRSLSQPLEQSLPSAEVLAKRAIVLSRDIRATRTERTIHFIGAVVLVVAVARMGGTWLSEHPVSNEFVHALWRSFVGLLGATGWFAVIAGVFTGGLIFLLSRLRKTLSE